MSFRISSSPNNTPFYGPETKQKQIGKQPDRDKYKHPFNETISLKDEVVFNANVIAFSKIMRKDIKDVHKSLHSQISLIKKNKKILKTEKQGWTKAEILEEAIKITLTSNTKTENIVIANDKITKNLWLDPVSRVEMYRSSINQHLDRRVQHFLLQLTTCMGTAFHFEVGKTQDQAVSASTLKVKYRGELHYICSRNAAHSSTFPCLNAYNHTEWKDYELKKRAIPQSIDFLKWSSMYTRMNSTIAMPISINQADIQIDGTQHNSEFSKKALEILNLASEEKITLIPAMKKFLKALSSEIRLKTTT